MDFARKKCAAKFVCVKTVIGKVVIRWPIRAQMVLVGDAPFYLKFSTKVTHPLLKRRFPVYRVAQNKIPHQTICSISATSGLILKIVEAA